MRNEDLVEQSSFALFFALEFLHAFTPKAMTNLMSHQTLQNVEASEIASTESPFDLNDLSSMLTLLSFKGRWRVLHSGTTPGHCSL